MIALNLVTLGNNLKALEMKAFDWSFFKVTFSSDTAVLSIYLEGVGGEFLDVFLSPNFQYTWTTTTSTKVEFNVFPKKFVFSYDHFLG